MLGRILLTGTIATSLSACSLLAPFEAPSSREGYVQTRNIADQDPYWRRFYELEQEIARLKASNAKLQAQIAPIDGVYTAAAPQSEIQVGDDSVVDDIIQQLRAQADHAIAVIDSAMASIANASPAPAESGSVPAIAIAEVNTPDIQGNLIRNEKGEVVKHTTYSSATKARYNYSVVYVYLEPQPWNDMWEKLQSANEPDKWRGFNPERNSYFIYVGAYVNQLDAEQRQQSLFALVGEKPDLRERVQNNALASK